jgi:PAS domain S-box-containing protein
VGYFSLDQTSQILEVNLKGASMVGMERRLLVKKRFTQFIVPAFQDSFYMFQKKAFKTRAIQTLEVQLKKKNGTPFWVQMDGVATQDTDGTFTHMRIIAIDIADKKKILENLKKSHDELEARVDERTTELMKANAQLESLSSLLLSTQEEERKRITEELHDSVEQTLAALKFNIEYLISQWVGNHKDNGFLILQGLIPKIQTTVVELKRIGKGLRPSILDDLGVLAALTWFCREIESVYTTIHIERVFEIEEDHIPENLKVVIYRVLQEALNNVAKHSRANRVMISLRKTKQAIEFSIKDNGKGFDVDAALSPENQRSGLGLISMIKRTELTGGSLVIMSDKETGTIIRASWPSA